MMIPLLPQLSRAAAAKASGRLVSPHPIAETDLMPAYIVTIERDGAERHLGAAAACVGNLEYLLRGHDAGQAGVRLRGVAGLDDLLAGNGMIGRMAARYLPDCRPVRAILFDKSEATNWALGWHQDRTIAVAARVEVDGFGPWTRKQGLLHVEPPFAVIERMMTLRVHIDPVDADNAPLLIALGSHRLGRIAETHVEAAVRACGTAVCLAERGDIWAYAAPDTPRIGAGGTAETTARFAGRLRRRRPAWRAGLVGCLS